MPWGVPGYDNGNVLVSQPVVAAFVNVPKLAMAIFAYRAKQGQNAGGN